MIKYALKCSQDHHFESWFQNSAAYEKLLGAGMVACSVCGDTAVEKTIMAPRVSTARKKAEVQPPQETTPQKETDTPAAPADAQAMIAKMRDYVEKNSTDVGENFATEARAMYLGDAPERMIHGKTRPEEAKSLIDEGVPIMPLPFMPKRDVN